MDKGVVVDLGNDIEGFVPMSQLGIKGTVNNPAEVLNNGDELSLRVIEVDAENHRIVLAVRDMAEVKKFAKERLKEIKEARAEEEAAAEEAAAEEAAAEEAASEEAQAEAPAAAEEAPQEQEQAQEDSAADEEKDPA